MFTVLYGSAYGAPYLEDPDFIVEKYVKKVKIPTSIHFVNDDMFILEKEGNIRLVQNGVLRPDPIFSVNVNSQNERGLLGITSTNSTVFLYFTEAESPEGPPLGNRIYQYDWNGNELTNEVLLHDLPVNANIPAHNGGAMVTGLDGKVYAIVGDALQNGVLQNTGKGNFDDTGIILMVDKTGANIKPSESEDPTQYYRAVGIRNSFGLAIDPQTGNLWDTENGESTFDEINLVEPKFNSGWKKVMGPSSAEQKESLKNYLDFQYSDPEFSWQRVVGPTDLTFVDSDIFKKYAGYLLVGDFHNGEISKFKLNEDRDGFIFEDSKLQDNVLNTADSSDEIKFAKGFEGVTSIEFGPDGFLYVAQYGGHYIYRIVPSDIFYSEEKITPNWFKKNVEFWSAEQIDNSTFIAGLKYLIEENILILSDFLGNDNQQYSIELFKISAESWKKGEITDIEFNDDIESLIGNNLIHLDVNKVRCNSSPGIAVDFSNCIFSGRDLSSLDISHSNFTNADLSNVNFYRTDLRNTDFTNSILVNSNLERVNLRGATLTNVDLSGSNMKRVNLVTADVSFGSLVQVDLSGANMHKINLTGANLEGANLSEVTLTESNLSGANLKGANFTGAWLNGPNLKNANWEDAITVGCRGCP